MKKRLIIIALFFSGAMSGYSQEDWGSSFCLEITKKIIPQLHVTFEEDFRLRDNFSTIDRFSTTFELAYKPWSFLKTGGAYNLINYKHPTKGWEIRHRYYLFAMGTYTYKRFSVSLRERFQHTYRVGIKETDKRANPKQVLRSRLKIEYDIRKSAFEPYLSVEMYNTLNDPQENKTSKWRYTAGTTYKLNKRSALEGYYRYTDLMDDDDVNGKHVLGIGYSYKF